ncbi:LapA family protein [Kiloniella laminariae]|uniref:LapA family protein n=1 Tax=Kiloniella laminariae TaxID=454162 RepID=A0ABT4LJW1_9PROT|nr:LapA family protein [Kiloniella laminariae]MCZ4281392.1 LapA family protein [Kiloniella laminariae]
MKRFSWVLTAPITLAILVFAVSNREDVTLEIWPFGIQLQYPLYLIILISLGVGLLIGALLAWLSAGTSRKKARQAEWRALDLQRDLSREQEKNQKLQSAATEKPSASGKSQGLLSS